MITPSLQARVTGANQYRVLFDSVVDVVVRDESSLSLFNVLRYEQVKASNVPVVPEDCLLIPLFPLGALMPGEQMPLRIFEPRYKQMLDDKVLGNGMFGILPENPDRGWIRGWLSPHLTCCIAEISNLHEIGIQPSFNSLLELTDSNFLRL